MADLKSSEGIRQLRHDFRQPLNVLRLTAENLRSKLSPLLGEHEAAILHSKLDRIEKQADRIADLVDNLGTDEEASARPPVQTK